jgi:hypothetical protein
LTGSSNSTYRAESFEKLDVWLHEHVEHKFGHKQAQACAGRVGNGEADVLVLERRNRLDVREGVAKNIIEDVASLCATEEFFSRDVDVRTLNEPD